MTRQRRIVITGIGCLTPIGNNLQDFWQALLAGKNGIERITQFDSSELTTHIAGEVKNFNPEDFIPKKDAKRMDRVIQFSVAAAKMAIEDAGLVINDDN